MQKVALVLHGWPQYEINHYFLVEYFKAKGYQTVYPNLLAKEYKFTVDGLIKMINDKLNGRIPSVIIGMSMGGLILPLFLKNNPKAKLIFIASGVKLETESGIFNFCYRMSNYTKVLSVFEKMLNLPAPWLLSIYKIINPYEGDEKGYEAYLADARKNVDFVKKIPAEKEKEVINLIRKIDNTDFLKNLENETLIFSAKNDHLMPLTQGEKLHELLKNSKIVIKEGEHFNCFSESDINEIDNFINR